MISVIIPTYNRLAYLPACLESVFAQTLSPHEIIVVDDGSTDGTAAYLASLGDKIRVVRQDNAGPGAARNRAAALATGDYLAFLDSDDLWPPWTLETFSAAIGSRSRPSFIVGANIRFAGEPPPPESSVPPLFRHFDCFFAGYERHRMPVPTPSVCICRHIFAGLGGFCDLYVGEDVDLWLRLGCARGFVWIEQPYLSSQRLHAQSVTRRFDWQIAGIRALLRNERQGRYPGGRRYRPCRDHRLAAAARSVAMACAASEPNAAVHVFRESLAANLRQGQWRYALLFAPYLLAVQLRRVVTKSLGFRRLPLSGQV